MGTDHRAGSTQQLRGVWGCVGRWFLFHMLVLIAIVRVAGVFPLLGAPDQQ
jgi:hypothetical protein